MGKWVAVAVVGILVAGCSMVTPGDRAVIDQTGKAGGYIKATATEPEVKQAGADVEANMALMVAKHGAADMPVPYTPANSEAARKQAASEKGVLGQIGEGIAGVVTSPVAGWVAGLLGLGGLWFRYRDKIAALAEKAEGYSAQAESLVKGIEAFRASSPDESKPLVETITKQARADGVADGVEATYQKAVKGNGEAKA